MAVEEEAFPRGGGRQLSGLERKRLRQDAEAEARRDFLAEWQNDQIRGKKKVKTAADPSNLIGSGKLPEFVELLRFKASDMLQAPAPAPGQKSQPRGHTVPLQDLFHVGQHVRAVIVSCGGQAEEDEGAGEGKDKGKHVALSLRLSRLHVDVTSSSLSTGAVLPASIASVEDHGYLVDFGIQASTGFLGFDACDPAPADSPRQKLHPGSLVDVVVTNASNPSMVHVSAKHQAVASAINIEHDGRDIGTLLPGDLVNARVRRVLSDGLVVSFLMYFQGTVDAFHLREEASSPAWAENYKPNQRLKARLLYVDPNDKRIYLSLKPHLLKLKPYGTLPMQGTVIEDAVVKRVDNALGAILHLPVHADAASAPSSEPAASSKVLTEPSTPAGEPTKPAVGFAHVSNIADKRVERLDKTLRVNARVRARVMGSRPFEGLSVVSLKPSVVDRALEGIRDLKPGGLVNGSVASIEDAGLLISLTSNLKALVPWMHTSNLPGLHVRRRLKPGHKVTARILEVNPSSRRVTLTLKRTLINTKLSVIGSWEDISVGMRSHGMVTGVQDYGVFVGFFGGLSGLVPASELNLEQGKAPSSAFEIGQVVKARVLSSDPVHNRLRLTLASSKSSEAPANAEAAEADADAALSLQPGDVATATLSSVLRPEDKEGNPRPPRYIVQLTAEGHEGSAPGVLEVDHLSDHPSGAAALQEALQVGDSLGEVLVLEQARGQGMYKVTRKALLKSGAARTPREVTDVVVGAVIAGVVSNVTSDGVFVRFLEGLTGRASLTQLADTFVSDPSAHYTPGQTVQAQVAAVDTSRGRISLNLKPSATATPECGLLSSLFADLELSDALSSAREKDSAVKVDWDLLPLGGPAKGSVHEIQPYGILYDLDAHPDLVGLITTAQQEQGKVETGQVLTTRILDVNKHDGIIDLTTKAALLAALSAGSQPSGGKLKVGQKVEACVELVRDDYLVLSLPERGQALGYAATQGYNQRSLDPHSRFRPGQQLQAVVVARASAATGGRLILSVPLTPGALAARQGDEEGRKRRFLAAGSVVKGTVAAIDDLSLDLHLPQGMQGHVHITELVDGPSTANPLQRFSVGDSVEAVCLGGAEARQGLGPRGCEMSLRPSMLQAAAEGKSVKRLVRLQARVSRIKPGQILHGFVAELTDAFAWVVLSHALRARLHALDFSSNAADIASFAQQLSVGQPLECKVIKVDTRKREIDVARVRDDEQIQEQKVASGTGGLREGTIVHLSGAGVKVQLGDRLVGQAALTDLHDAWVDNALEGLSVGQGVRAQLLPLAKGGSTDARRTVPISLRPSLCQDGAESAPPAEQLHEALDLDSLKEGQQVQGYVRHASKQGVFVTLSRALDARIRLSNLAEGFVADPLAAFPAGMHVQGHIVSIAPSKAEMSLKKLKPSWHNLDASITEGTTVRGTIRRLEKFGVFIDLADTTVTGMAHISELTDSFVKDPSELFKAGQGVKAKVLQIDRQARRLALGLKPSYFVGESNDEELDDGDSDNDDLEAALAEASESEASSEDGEEGIDAELMLNASPAGAESSSDDDSQHADESASEEESEPNAGPSQQVAGLAVEGVGWGDDSEDEKADSNKRKQPELAALPQPEPEAQQQTKKQRRRLKQQQEEAARRAQEAQVANLIPQDPLTLEKAVQDSPNSSYAWLQYMAFHISVGEIAAARATAERALREIHFREEGEKHNVWVAWLNLESQYGDPPEEAVMKLFHRALPYNDPKKLHFALLDVLGRSRQAGVLEQMLKVVTRKFSGSSKAWLAHLRHCIGQSDTEGAQKVLEKGLKSLPRHKHIKVLSQAALAHFRAGTHEQGRNILESILRNYPKRLDLWNVYIDQEVKAGDRNRVRALFNRATHADLPPRKMKALFKRFLEYEQAHGDAASVAGVQKSAQQYVDAHFGA